MVTQAVESLPSGFRLLEDLERVNEGDRFYGRASGLWLPVTECLGMTVGEAKQVSKHCVAFARKVYVPSARSMARGWMNG